MAKVLGVGGVFFKSKDTTKLSNWYRDVLGIEMGEYGATFTPESMPKKGYTAFSLFKQETNYFAPSKQPYMINFIVDDLAGVLKNIEQNGGTLCGEPEEFEYGKFGWFLDPEGNKVELWQPL